MSNRWKAEQVLALAPDAAGRQAALRLAGSRSWTETGAGADLVWGSCAGSGAHPYRTIVDLSGPAYKCTCPSRKFPCKHALALLLLWSAGTVPDAEPVDFAQSWQAGRATRAAAPKTPPDPKAAAKRAEQRAARVAAGMTELQIWLQDQVRAGLSSAAGAGYRHVDAIAARMVDAQAPGVAAALRRTAGIPASGDGWPAELLGEYANLQLLARAHEQLETLPDDFAATVRSRVGYTVAKADVLARPAVAGRWQVMAVRELTDATIATRRVWLRHADTAQFALLLMFAPGGGFGSFSGFGAELEATVQPGSELVADVHHYPGRPQLRAVVGTRQTEPAPAREPQSAVNLDGLLDEWSAALAADPWLTDWPALVVATPVLDDGRGWLLVDTSGNSVPLVTASIDPWRLLAVSGGEPVTVAGEWSPAGLLPLTVWHGDQAVTL